MNRSVLSSEPEVRRDVPIAPLTTYKLGGPAAYYLEADDEPTLLRVFRSLPSDVEVLILGRGSNLVVADGGFPGLVVRLGEGFGAAEVGEDGTIEAGAAVSLAKLARLAATHGRGGLEFFVGIPGSVGGAVRMNAGGHGRETRDCLITARILQIDEAAVVERDATQLELRYRHSNLTDRDIVLGARFGTDARARVEVEEELRAITRWRRDHQPGGTFNAGSVFKNPPGDSAGRIIDAVGLKAYRRGEVRVSDVHANFFVASEGASSQDIWDLVWHVRRRVGEATGVWLVPEIRFAGRFRPSEDQGVGPGGAR